MGLAQLPAQPRDLNLEPRSRIGRTHDDGAVPACRALVLSDDLRYAHSNGKVDTKASLTASLLGGDAKYVSYKYNERTFKFPAPDVATMAGRLEVQAIVDGVSMTTGISYLAVWRLEKGQWKFLAWQSCKIPPATPAK